MARFVLHTGMHSTASRRCLLVAFVYAAAWLAGQQAAWAQSTIGTGATSGVAVDADGVLRRVMANDLTGDLARQRAQEAMQKLDRDVAHRSPLRKISLTRLDRVIKQRMAEGRGIDDTM